MSFSPWYFVEKGEKISAIFYRRINGRDHFLFTNENEMYSGDEEMAERLQKETLREVIDNHFLNLLSGKDFKLSWFASAPRKSETKKVVVEASENVCYLIALMAATYEELAKKHSHHTNVKNRSFVWVECGEAVTRKGRYATLEDFGIDNTTLRRKSINKIFNKFFRFSKNQPYQRCIVWRETRRLRAPRLLA